MHRKLGSNKIDVSSTDSSISNGKYTAKASVKNYEKTINSVWLALIGITEQHLVNKNGTANMPQISETQCPFCDGKIRIKKTPNYIEAAKSDYKKIKLQAQDLQRHTVNC